MKHSPAPSVRSLLAAGLLAGGVALAQEPGYLHLRTPGASVTARVSPTEITGPEFQLSHTPDFIRGRAYGRPVRLEIKDSEIGGLFGELPVRLKLEREDDGALKARGLFAGVPTRLELDAEELKGTVGVCSYELKAKDLRYEGWRSCGGPPEFPVFVEVPPSLTRSGPATTLAAVALFLAQP
ncbi:hypothetical protein P2318_02160 [Myxococcaceae bacterium GXIMD 01537]